MTGSVDDRTRRRRPDDARRAPARAPGDRRRDARPRDRGTSSSSAAGSSAPGRCSTPPRAGCVPRSSSRTTSRPARRRARPGSSTAGCATSSSSASASSARRWPSARGCCELAPHLVRIEPLLFPIYGIPYRVEGVLRRGAHAVRHPRRAARRRLASAASRRRRRSSWHRPSAATASTAACCITTGSRTTPATRWPWPGPRWPPAPLAVTRVRATGLRGGGSGTIAALMAEDLETGKAFEIATSAVVDATGVWAADPDHPFRGGSLRILPSRGAHLVVPRERIAEQDRADDPGPGQDRVPRAVARPLADRDDRRAVRGTRRRGRPPRAGRSTACSTRSTRRWT